MVIKSGSPLNRIPVEVWLLIAEKLSVRDLQVMGATDKHVRSIIMPLLRGCKLLQMITREPESSSVEFLIKSEYVDIRVKDAHHMTALHYAAMKNYKRLIRFLTTNSQHKTLLNAPENRRGDTPLIIAVRCQNEEVMRLLLDAGADANVLNAHGESVLFWTIKRQQPNLARMLLNRGADPNQIVRHGLTLLILAIMSGCLGSVAALLEQGCDVEQPDGQGHRPLAWAVVSDDIATARLLISYNTKISVYSSGDREERSPLVWAVMMGNVDMVRLLLSQGADTEHTQLDRRAPLIWAVIHRDKSVAEVLLQSGARPNETDGNGQTALAWAILNSDKEMVELLLEYGADAEGIRRNEWLAAFVPGVERERTVLTH
ncbi:hypothetical protein PENANT_c134G11062 [Penicillium antarcticum]|uniref:Uncharacterized protein n=2 Tax=Penicillium antarcticum TaxID=416450 RepID=A0A1V6PGU3_9EURO|nr:hypothetical protein PENANT_c134G11062 [Penicillium antarcticum]